jgi:Mn-dependent DtxR family transcriptional regulator
MPPLKRGHTLIQRVKIVSDYLHKHGRIRAATAAKLIGIDKRNAARMLSQMEAVSYMTYDGRTREWVQLDEDWSEDHITFGR